MSSRHSIALLAVGAAVSCNETGRRSLTPVVASEVVVAHLRAVAPFAVNPDSFRTEVDEMGEISPNGERPVRFRTIWALADTAGGWVDTSAVLTAWMRQDGRRASVTRYDSALLAHLAEIVDEDRSRQYYDLIESIHHIYHSMTQHGWYYNEGGIPPDTIALLVQRLGMHHGQVAWGLTPPGDSLAQMLWVRSARDTAATCALPMTWGRLQAPGFEWVEDRVYFTCRGRGPGIYSRPAIPRELRERVARDGVLHPFNGGHR